MTKKGMSMIPIAILIITVMTGALLATIFLDFGDQLDEEEEELEQQIEDMERTIVLENRGPVNPDDKLKGVTWFTMLRAEHCLAIPNYLLQENTANMEEHEIREEMQETITGDELQPPLDVLRYSSLPEIRNLECHATDRQVNFIELREMAENIAEMDQSDVNSLILDAFTDALADRIISIAQFFYCRGILENLYVFCEHDYPETVFEIDEANDMEGKYGNVGFTVEDTFSVSNQELIKGLELPGGPGYTRYYEGHTDDDAPPWNEGHYWDQEDTGIGGLHFAPDPRIAYYNAVGELDVTKEEILECQNYPLAPYKPSIRNIPHITNDQIPEGSPGDISPDIRGVVPPQTEIGEEEMEEIFEHHLQPYADWGVPDYNQLLEDMEMFFELCRGMLPGDVNDPEFNNIEVDYMFCEGTTGVIQANKGVPLNEGEASYFAHNMSHSVTFPYVEADMNSNPHSCVENHIIESPSNTADGGEIPGCNEPEDLGGNCGLKEHQIMGISYYEYAEG